MEQEANSCQFWVSNSELPPHWFIGHDTSCPVPPRLIGKEGDPVECLEQKSSMNVLLHLLHLLLKSTIQATRVAQDSWAYPEVPMNKDSHEYGTYR